MAAQRYRRSLNRARALGEWVVTRAACATEAYQEPHCVLLLDEIREALNPEVFNLLLQVMDHGTLPTTTAARRTSAKC